MNDKPKSSAEEPKTVRAPSTQNAGGPSASAKPQSGGTYSQGTKSGGEAGTMPSGAINPKNLAKPVVTFELDGQQVDALPNETIWAVAKRLGTHIPHLCHKPEPGYRPDGNCRAC